MNNLSYPVTVVVPFEFRKSCFFFFQKTPFCKYEINDVDPLGPKIKIKDLMLVRLWEICFPAPRNKLWCHVTGFVLCGIKQSCFIKKRKRNYWCWFPLTHFWRRETFTPRPTFAQTKHRIWIIMCAWGGDIPQITLGSGPRALHSLGPHLREKCHSLP